MSVIRHFRDVLTEGYGKALQRIPIDLYRSCPHRVDGRGGCTFCAEDGARARHLRRGLDLKAQVQRGVDYVRERYGAEPPYIAYFQSYTNTFGNLNELRSQYEEVLALENFAMVIISTRPDCLGDDVLDWLGGLAQRYELWVELGIQTANDVTLERVNRGHDWACSADAVRRLHARGIKVAAHLILGLPGETMDDFVHTAQALAALPVDAVKLHQMMILKHTPMAKLWAEQPSLFHVRNEYDYAAAVCAVLRELSPDICVMRLCADAPEEGLIAPKWWMKKGQFLEFIESIITSEGDPLSMLVRTDDGSFTAYHPSYRQHFHNSAGAEGEAIQRFIIPSGLRQRIQSQELAILDIGFGLGYNALAAAECADHADACPLRIVTLESDERVFPLAEMAQTATQRKATIRSLATTGRCALPNGEIEWRKGDARAIIRDLDEMFDIVFLDAFSPDVNPELWTFDLFRRLYRLMNPGGMLLTYSAAFPVIGGLHRAGFMLAEGPVFGKRRGGLIAVKGKCLDNLSPLRDKDLQIALRSTAGLSFRDPIFRNDPDVIRRRREATVERLRTKGVPKWIKS